MNLRHFRRKGGTSVVSLTPGPLADIYSDHPDMEEVFYAPGDELHLSNPHTPPAGKGQGDELPQ